jgi:hypothetical protein
VGVLCVLVSEDAEQKKQKKFGVAGKRKNKKPHLSSSPPLLPYLISTCTPP